MPPAKRPKIGPVEKATKADLGKLPAELAASSLGASALALARELDSDSSATSKSMCAKAHLDLMDRLRELAPPEVTHDDLDEIAAARARRLAARGSAASN